MSDQPDLHEPTAAGPDPAPEPTPVVGASEATPAHPPGTAAPALGDPQRPEKAVGAAFAGGLAAAWLLKRMARRKHRW